jgi:4-amino-4-deoxy-L-arabinose transferase-like glycosyltransferase
LNPEERSYLFLKVWNGDRFERWLWEARGVTLIFGLLLGAATAWGVQRRPRAVQWAALTLWAFEPTVLGFSVIAQADIALAAVYVIAVLEWVEGRDRPWGAWLFGALVGIATCMKFTGVVLMAVFFVLELVDFQRSDIKMRRILDDTLKALVGFALVVCTVFGLATAKLPGHPMPWDLFLLGVRSLAALSWQPAYFFGAVRYHHAFWYFPVAWVLKSGLAFLALLILAVWKVPRLDLPAWKWIPSIIFFLALIHVPNAGVRYLLPCTPFLIWIAAEGFGCLWEGWGTLPRRTSRALALTLLLGQVLSTSLSFPNHISYFNDLVPKTAKKYLLADSNLDIGQDTGRMVRKLDELGLCKTKIAYFGGFPPVVCGNICNRWSSQDSQQPEEGWSYALGVEYEQLGSAYDPDAVAITNGWFRNIPPDIRIGETWRIWVNPASKIPKSGLKKK